MSESARSRPGISLHGNSDIRQALYLIKEPLTRGRLIAKLYLPRAVRAAGTQIKRQIPVAYGAVRRIKDLDRQRLGRLTHCQSGSFLIKSEEALKERKGGYRLHKEGSRFHPNAAASGGSHGAQARKVSGEGKTERREGKT